MNDIQYNNLKEQVNHGDFILPFKTYSGRIDKNDPIINIHWHNEIEMVIVEDGECDCMINLENYTAKKGDIIKTIEIKNGSSETKSLDIILENDLNLLTQTSSKLPEPDIKLNTILFAPIAKNTVLGKAYYNVNGTTYSVNLLASHDVEENDMLIFILISCLASILLIIFFVILFFELKKRKKRKEKYDTEY